MALYVHHAARLGALADVAADVLATPLADPLTAEVIAVPTAGVRDFLVCRLAERLGVAANIELPFPGRFVATALGIGTEGDPWDVERLTWAVLAVLDRGEIEVPGWSPAGARRYAVARRIADLFDRYASHRPQLLGQWRAGAFGDGTVGEDGLAGRVDPASEWQFRLWRAVREHLGTPGPAERLPELTAALRAGELDVPLPARVGWFGFGGVTTGRLELLEALAATRDVHVFAVRPSPVQWERTPALPPASLTHRRRFDELRASPSRGQDDPAGPATHPLVRSWGGPSGELAALVNGTGAAVRSLDGPGAAGGAPTLLRHLQDDIVADRPPTPFPAAADGSIEVHACHGVTRQLEVLRDTLGHLFVADPTLEPHDVLVLCGDIERFEPFAAAVFGRGTLPVPLRVSDLALGSENPVAAALVAVLRAVRLRCTAIDVLDLATLDPIRRRLGLTADDLDRIGTWIVQLGTSWGIDADHRAGVLSRDRSVTAPADVLRAGTWDATLRALLSGAALPAPEPRAVALAGGDPVVPYDDLSRDAVVTAGRLAELVARLGEVRARLAATRRPGEWCDTIVEVLALLCAPDPADVFQMTDVTAAIEEVRTAAATGSAGDVLLGPDDAIALVDELVGRRSGRLRLRSGAVTMTGLAPLRNVPARVVCLLGFDEVSLRPPALDGDDVLAAQPCVGEPDRRADRRQCVLDALLAAGDRFVVVCDGNDVTTNRPLHFAVQLGELLDTVNATLGADDDGGSPVLHRHPLRAHDERNLAVGAPRTFDDVMLRAALARRRAGDADESEVAVEVRRRWTLPLNTGTPPHDADENVTIDQLVEACTRPARTLLRDALDVRLPGDVDDVDTSIPLALGPLDRATLGRRLLAAYRAAAGEAAREGIALADAEQAALAAWRSAERLGGRLPPGRLGGRALDEIAAEVGRLIDTACAKTGRLDRLALLGASGDVAVDVPLAPAGWPAVRLVDTVGEIVDGGKAGRTICGLTYSRPKARTHVGAALRLAACVVVSGRTDWYAVNATRGAARRSRPACELLAVTGGVAAAQRLLDVAARLRAEALVAAIPLFEETSRAMYFHPHHAFDVEQLEGHQPGFGDLADTDTGFVWSGTPTAEIVHLRPLRYATLLWGAIESFLVDVNAERSA